MLIKEFLETNPNPIEPGYVFTLLPEKTKDIYYGYVKKAADSLGLRCESFLDFTHPGDALRDILANIQKAEILIYDITNLTPNVMWELGLGLAIKDAERVIVIREKNDTPLHFDIYSHSISFEYDPQSEESLAELYKTLRDEMEKITRASRKKAPIQSPEVKSLLDNTLKAVERKEWIAAEALFQTMDAREPENWYIYNQWGIMHRSKGEFEAASEKFNKALTLTEFEDEKALIYTELAGLSQKPILLGASAPQAVRPRDSFAARFVAYIKGLEKDIEAELIKRSRSSQIHLALKEARWQVGTKVKVHLSSPDLIVSSPEEEFIWRGEQEIIEFLVQVPLNISEKKTVLQFDVLIGGIRIANLLLDLDIGSRAIDEPILVITEPASTAFASFASKDNLRVMDRLTEIRKSGLDIFDQCLALHPGEMWKPKLEQEIKSRDLFLLFWSANAKKSKWVQWEWKTALRERGISGIEPHPLDPISQAKPPRALKDLHFGDPYMLIRKAYEESP